MYIPGVPDLEISISKNDESLEKTPIATPRSSLSLETESISSIKSNTENKDIVTIEI
jgi:hypothetical protein